ncbi:hypothetical protein [Luteibaculum oceani]|uniref:Uncharacterized protein n=1 Tax=Luteibaculum oceani TaxID=1294296 RepID=A0A5C6VKV7_9FLAO|nr:hypothetical protein [Luteibaculum oceani]TXC85411.1 hypothetical protein FRX97_01940 [Luteibaculum oceani]
MKIVKIIAAVIAGFIVGSIVNGGLIMLGSQIIPPPLGVDPMDSESIIHNIGLFKPKHFLFPFLAHALGTLVGAFIALLIAKQHIAAWILGGLFLLAGIANVFMIPGPTWFAILDVALAYLPMAWLAIRLRNK